MSIIDQFWTLGTQTQLIIAGVALIIIGSIFQAIGGKTDGRGKRGKACAWCGQEIMGKEQKCSLCKDKFCSQKCVMEHKQNIHAPRT